MAQGDSEMTRGVDFASPGLSGLHNSKTPCAIAGKAWGMPKLGGSR